LFLAGKGPEYLWSHCVLASSIVGKSLRLKDDVNGAPWFLLSECTLAYALQQKKIVDIGQCIYEVLDNILFVDFATL
jgi:hypothetical protein